VGKIAEWYQPPATVVFGALPVVPADRRRLRRLLQNLIANALKLSHLAPPPPSRSTPSGPGDEWTFSVCGKRHRHPATYAGAHIWVVR